MRDLKLFLLILLATGLQGAQPMSEQQILQKIPVNGEVSFGGMKVKVSRANFHVIDGRTYYFNFESLMPWLEAVQFCNILDMSLVSFETEQEHETVTNYFYANVTTNGYWTWTSGYYLVDSWFWTGSGQQVTYTNWATGEPNDTQSLPHVAIYFRPDNKLWYDLRIDYHLYLAFVCEE